MTKEATPPNINVTPIFAPRKTLELIHNGISEREIITVQSTLALGFMTRFCCQSFSTGPDKGNCKIHEWNFGEDLENKKADKIKNGVVGSTGKNAPMTPSKKLTHAKINKTHFKGINRSLFWRSSIGTKPILALNSTNEKQCSSFIVRYLVCSSRIRLNSAFYPDL